MKYLLPLLFAASLSATEVTLTWKGGSDCSHEMRLQLEDGTWEPMPLTVPGVFERLIETDGYKAAQVWAKNDFKYSDKGTNILTFDAPPDPTGGSLQVKEEKPQAHYKDVKRFTEYVQGDWRG